MQFKFAYLMIKFKFLLLYLITFLTSKIFLSTLKYKYMCSSLVSAQCNDLNIIVVKARIKKFFLIRMTTDSGNFWIVRDFLSQGLAVLQE